MITAEEAYLKLTRNRLKNLKDPYEINLSQDISQAIYDLIDEGHLYGTEIDVGVIDRKSKDSCKKLCGLYNSLGYQLWVESNFKTWTIHIRIPQISV